MECQVKKNDNFHHFLPIALNHGPKATKAANFYQQGIENLVERWEEIVNNNNGEYIIV